jgi:hypothetical protein
MPYIGQDKRDKVDTLIEELADKISGAGHLNYVVTRLCMLAHLHVDGYQRVAEITGVLENVKQEYYRRVATPYETRKMVENGDITEYIP